MRDQSSIGDPGTVSNGFLLSPRNKTVRNGFVLIPYPWSPG